MKLSILLNVSLRMLVGSGVLVLLGCGQKEGLVSVSGTVFLDGKPLEGATVTFHPIKGGPVGSGVTEESGRFTVMTGTRRGLKPGEYIVTVQKIAEVSRPDSLAPEMPPRLLTPLQYANPKTSPLRYTAPGGPADFKISSTAK